MMGSTTNLNCCKILETSSGLEEASGRLSNSPRTGQSISFLPCWWMTLQTCLHLKGPPRYEEALGKIVAVVPKTLPIHWIVSGYKAYLEVQLQLCTLWCDVEQYLTCNFLSQKIWTRNFNERVRNMNWTRFRISKPLRISSILIGS